MSHVYFDKLIKEFPLGYYTLVASQEAQFEKKNLQIDELSNFKELEKKLLDQRNLNYVDGSIMGGPPNEKYSPRVYLSGKLAKKILFLSGKGIEIITLTGSDFQASAMKMVYASITKGSKALVAGAFIVAKKNDVFQELIEELEYSEEYFHNVALKQVPSIKHKAYRWIGEMNEISSTFKDSGLTGGFHSESEKIYELIKDLPSGKFSFDEIILKITDKMKE